MAYRCYIRNIQWQIYRIISVGIIIAIFLSTTNTSLIAIAQENSEGRIVYKTTTFTQNIWHLSSRANGTQICEVIISHAGFPTDLEMMAACETSLIPPVPTATASPYPSPTPTGTYTPKPTKTPTLTPAPTEVNIQNFYDGTYWVFISSKEVTQTEKIKLPEMILEIEAPVEQVPESYVTIRAYDPAPGYNITSIQGLLEGKPFKCTEDACNVYFDRDAQITYWATSSFGDESQHYTATLRISQNQFDYNVSITNRSLFYRYVDAAAKAWKGIALGTEPQWTYLPQSPSQLNTNKTLHYLAAKLIVSGIVDATDCPGSGLFDNWAPNGCGIEKARPALLSWQNRFDNIIWNASKEHGVPAKLIKAIIEQESQFWPDKTGTDFVDEYGLGQLNEFGADVALRWDKSLHDQVCSSTLFDCPEYYANLPSYSQAMLRGRLLQLVNANCPTCEYGIDLIKAEESIDIIAQTIYANARQAGYILDEYEAKTQYEDLWRFTMVSYHAGYQCLEDAIAKTISLGEPLNWSYVSYHLTCQGAGEYVDKIWEKLNAYEEYYPSVVSINAVAQFPTVVPLRPTPTYRSDIVDGTIHIFMFLDRDGDYQIGHNERISEEKIQIKFSDGENHQGEITNGEIHINFTGKRIGSKVTVTAPDLYETFSETIPASGDLLIIFRIEQPELPINLP